MVITRKVADSMEKCSHFFQESERLGQSDESETNGGINLRGRRSHPSASIQASKITDSPPQPYIARQTHEQYLEVQFVGQRHKVSKFRHVLEVLQRAARQIQGDQSMSQSKIFRSLAPLVIFLYLLGVGVVLPRQQQYRYSQTPEGNSSVAKMIILFFIGMALALVVLRSMVWLVGVLAKGFCQVDLTQIFKRGECVDVNGRGMGEAELIVGGIFT